MWESEWKRTEIRYIITRTSIILNWASPVWRNLYTSLRHRSCSLPVRGRGIFWRSQGSLATTLPFGISIYPTTRRSHHFFGLKKWCVGSNHVRSVSIRTASQTVFVTDAYGWSCLPYQNQEGMFAVAARSITWACEAKWIARLKILLPTLLFTNNCHALLFTRPKHKSLAHTADISTLSWLCGNPNPHLGIRMRPECRLEYFEKKWYFIFISFSPNPSPPTTDNVQMEQRSFKHRGYKQQDSTQIVHWRDIWQRRQRCQRWIEEEQEIFARGRRYFFLSDESLEEKKTSVCTCNYNGSMVDVRAMPARIPHCPEESISRKAGQRWKGDCLVRVGVDILSLVFLNVFWWDHILRQCDTAISRCYSSLTQEVCCASSSHMPYLRTQASMQIRHFNWRDPSLTLSLLLFFFLFPFLLSSSFFSWLNGRCSNACRQAASGGLDRGAAKVVLWRAPFGMCALLLYLKCPKITFASHTHIYFNPKKTKPNVCLTCLHFPAHRATLFVSCT